MSTATIKLRDAQDADYPLFARLFPELTTGDPVPSAERWRERVAPDSLIAEVDGAVAGYIFYEVLDGAGYIRHIVVDAPARGRGLGRHMVQAVGERMRERGCRTWRLNVRPENTPAIELYRSVGLEVVHASVAFRFPWALVDRLPPPRRSLDAVPVGDDEATAIEAHFGLPSGQLRQLGAAAGVYVRRLADPSRPELDPSLGVAAFDTGFPGCFPFRLGDARDLRSMLAGLRPLATSPEMGVVAEGHEELAQVLIAAGATIKFRFVHMTGELAGAASEP